ncbi:MAG: hypothetical protein K9G70_13260 [Prolixibacteraceae bacterium]|nr:hypothetical protein [Prolixibacteraceae bacterium]
MKKRIDIIGFLLIGIIMPLQLLAGNHYLETTKSIPSSKQINRLKVYIEGSNVDFDYIRRNVRFVDFVNDPKVSDVHVIVTRNFTGGGGINYMLNFYTKRLSQIGDITLNCISSPGDTDDVIRECMTRALKLGLMPYVNETRDGDTVDILYTKNDLRSDSISTMEDPWNQWVFRVSANGWFNLEESIKKLNYSFNVRADKVTEQYKIRASYYMRDKIEEIENDGEWLSSINKHKSGRVQSVYSLSERWSAGVFLSYFQSTFWNTRNSYDFKPALEYNFFPWDISDKKRFTVSYFAGLEMKDYYETTIFNKDDENLWEQNLKINFEVIQPWGEIETRLEGSTYFHDVSKNSVTLSSDLSIRIMQGLSVNFNFGAQNVHNQLYLPAEEVSLEDVLLGNKKLPSTFQLWGGMGIRVQFGSLYNNVVNNRL